jgi:predicted transcriptional regulator
MKKVLMVLFVLLMSASLAMAAGLKVGDKAPACGFKDSAGTMYNLDNAPFAGKVVAVYYTDKASAEGMAVVNLKDTPLPNFILKKLILKKQEEIKSPILIDENYTLVNGWGLNGKAYNIVLFDKSRTIRYIYKGGERAVVPPAEIDKLISLIRQCQVK